MQNTTIAKEYAFFNTMVEICKNYGKNSAEIEAETENQAKMLNSELALIDAVMVPKRIWFLSTVKVLNGSTMGNTFETYAILMKAKETFELLMATCENYECRNHGELIECFDNLRQDSINCHTLCNEGSVNSKMLFSYLENECYHLLVKISPYTVSWWKESRSIAALAERFDPKVIMNCETLEELCFI